MMNEDQIVVLYVEDDEVDQLAFKRMVEQENLDYNSIMADSVETAKEYLDQLKIDIIISDYNLGDGTAIDVIKESNGIPVIITTGAGDEEIAVNALKAGAYDYLTKDQQRNYLKILPVTLENVLKQKKANEQLEMLSEALKSINDMVSITDIEDNIVFVNDSFIKTYGYSKEELLGENISLVSNTKSVNEVKRDILPATLKGGIKTELINKKKDGTEFPIALSTSAIYGSNKKPAFLIGVANDITEKRLAEQAQIKNEKLESIGILAGGIAHDFNNILTAIIGNLSLAILETAPHEKMYELIDNAMMACKQSEGLTHQLLTFSKGGTPIKENASLVEIVRGTGNFVTRGSGIRCKYNIPLDISFVNVDVGQMSQVINNIIINAIQVMENGGCIYIDMENVEVPSPSENLLLKPGNYVRVSIKDEGPGIPSGTIEHIFDPYFTTKSSGSGLGLATCYSIINKHGGHVFAESDGQNGSKFVLFIPASPKAQISQNASVSKTINQDVNILLMDDENPIREVAKLMLNKLGCRGTFVKDGMEAISVYEEAFEQKQGFDIVILDITIPGGIGGKDVINKLREINPDVMGIVTSGYSDDPVMANYKEYGFKARLLKPFGLKDLSESISKIIG